MADNPPEFPDLLQRLHQGDSDAAREILVRYGPLVLRVVRRLLSRRLRARYDSQDFVQDVLASLLTKTPGQVPPEESDQLANYLARMARNKVIDAYRAAGPNAGKDADERSLDGSAAYVKEELHAGQPTASQVAVAKEELERLRQGHRESNQDILTLLAVGHTYPEIARQLGVSEKTVHRLVKKLERRRRA